MEYQFKTEPMPYQLSSFLESRDFENYGVLWEQGTGKTKLLVDTVCYNHMQEKIDAVILVAPNGVHENFSSIDPEAPGQFMQHAPHSVFSKTMLYTYHSSNSKKKAEKIKLEKLMKHPGLSILSMTYDGFMTGDGKDFALRFLKNRKVAFVLDEAHRIKSDKAKRTKAIVKASPLAAMRRIATGTLVANTPFDVYMPIYFLDQQFWRSHGFPTFTVFKFHFGIWKDGYNAKLGRKFKQLVCYKNLEELHELIKKIGSRFTKQDVLPDLPERTYTKFYFDLSDEQLRLYEAIKEDFIALLDSGDMITAPLAITRLLRLQQITCGYVPVDDGDPGIFLTPENPRLEALKEFCEDVNTSTIIWCRFTKDIDLITSFLGDRCVRYDGAVDPRDRAEIRKRFQTGKVQFFVGNAAVGGEGVDLFNSHTAVYYSNSFKLLDREQSEARQHRKGQKNPVQYIDFVARNTVDEIIIESLRNKTDIASMVMGDSFRSRL